MKSSNLSIPVGMMISLFFLSCASTQQREVPSEINLTKETLMDKIKGGWAGQTIGCTYGGPTEFKFNGTMVQAYNQYDWKEAGILDQYQHNGGLYDDLYMDLTFVAIFEKYGLDAPIDSFANAFARAPYPLWHANQAARYNILNGIMPPASGHWTNNPHADDIDFQIEADFAGLMAPGMVNTSAQICDKIGHIMNYGDGLYGGIYVAAMYSLAFASDDIHFIVNEALKVIPTESKYHQCISDVIAWHKKYPTDWKQTWFELERKWSEDLYCPEGVHVPFNIDATINSAYVAVGLLYGAGDFFQTMDIAMRCGQDSDCNPATALGILGTMKGYKQIPQEYLKSIALVEDMNFAYTDISLNKAYQMSFEHALQVITSNGGHISKKEVTIAYQTPVPVALEVSFPGYYPVKSEIPNKDIQCIVPYSFEGKGVIVAGRVEGAPNEYIAQLEWYLDGKLMETVPFPASFTTRRDELFRQFELSNGTHKLEVKWLNPVDGAQVKCNKIIVLGDTPPVASSQ